MTVIIQAPSVPTILGVIVSLLIVDVFAVCMRWYARRGLGQPLKIDDWLMIPCIIGLFSCASCLLHGLRTHTMGYPAPQPAESVEDSTSVKIRSDAYASDWSIVTTRMLEFSFFCVLVPTLGLIKLSVLLFYRRIFVIHSTFSNLRNMVISGMIVVVIVWTVGYTFALVFDCGVNWTRPFYDFDFANQVCVNSLMLGYSFAISDLITDVLIALIPIPMIWKLHLPTAQRFAVMCVFGVGFLSAAASAVRLVVAVWIQGAGYNEEFDEELNLTAELFWGMLELTTALLASCLPTLRSLIKVPFVHSAVRSLQSLLSFATRSHGTSFDAPSSPPLEQFQSPGAQKEDKIVKESAIMIIRTPIEAV